MNIDFDSPEDAASFCEKQGINQSSRISSWESASDDVTLVMLLIRQILVDQLLICI